MTRKYNEIALSDRQLAAMEALDDPGITEVLYGGAKGGGKSYLMCLWALSRCLEIIEQCDMREELDHPIPVGWLGRLKAKHFKDTTLQTWYRFVPKEYYTINTSSQEIIVLKRVKIDYGGLDSQDAINKFNSAEYGFIGLDQAEECTKDQVSVLLASRRLIINGQRIRPKALFTANPAQCWLKNEFILNQSKTKKFVQALPSDNPWLDTGYIDILKDAFKHRKELLSAYLDGSWDSFEGSQQIIFERNITAACKLRHYTAPLKKFIVIDPARFGDDETVMYLFHNTDIVKERIYGQLPSDRLNNLAHVWALEEKVSAVVVDECGLGGPIVDWQRRLAGGQYAVIGINSAAKSSNPDRYYNVRAEMWFTSSRMLAEGQVSLSADQWMDGADWALLKSQLCSVEYDFRGSAVLVEPKEDIKERIGRSPDRADCAVMGWYIYPRIPAKSEGVKKVHNYHTSSVSAMAC